MKRLWAAALLSAPAGIVHAEKSEPLFVLEELRGGILDHDTRIFTDGTEDGWDFNLEAQFRSPSWLQWALSPKPTIGLNANPYGGTNMIYAGPTWQYNLGAFFAELNLSIAVNDNDKFRGKPSEGRQLGCAFGFYEAASIGYRFMGKHSIMGVAQHHSNAGLCEPNSGITNIGLRYGYNFCL